MNRNCRTVQSSLSAYLDGELGGTERSRIADHLASCAACAGELELLKKTGESLSQLGEPPEAPDHWHEIRGRLLQRHTRPWFPQLTWSRWTAVAASLLLLLVITLFWPFTGRQHTAVEPYLGLYLLAADASDVLSTRLSLGDVDELGLKFPVYAPASLNSWERRGIYLHRLHGQPVVQIFYAGPGGDNYCVFQQSSDHHLDFGARETRQELVRNQICTKLSSHRFTVLSWSSGKTLFTLVSTSENMDLNSVAETWIQTTAPSPEN